MVDRITPRPTPDVVAERVKAATGCGRPRRPDGRKLHPVGD